jgi:hypothetical protein
MSEETDKNFDQGSEHHSNLEVIAMLQPIVTLMAQQEERLSKKIDTVHADVKRINGSVAQAHKDIADQKHECSLRGIQCAKTLENVKGANWVIERLSEMSKRPKTAVVIFVLFIIGIQTLVLESIKNNWLEQVWNYVRLVF